MFLKKTWDWQLTDDKHHDHLWPTLQCLRQYCQVLGSKDHQLWMFRTRFLVADRGRNGLLSEIWVWSVYVYLLLLDSLLTTPSVGVKPEKLLLWLLVLSHDLLGPGGGAAHQRGHCTTRAGPGLLGDNTIWSCAVTGHVTIAIVSSHRVGSHGGDTDDTEHYCMSLMCTLSTFTTDWQDPRVRKQSPTPDSTQQHGQGNSQCYIRHQQPWWACAPANVRGMVCAWASTAVRQYWACWWSGETPGYRHLAVHIPSMLSHHAQYLRPVMMSAV